ncbi:hypothetical protein [Nocardia mexicana]|uniref:Secreted protein n=1 Tax=Nocardia mexicana TaxID=279262 RepID=A0A370H379_9NOCA|nr:hypothetical protein [Nocardia mexicana]RDI50666.1 hypothetical protein DFR68_105143 [Nocardia mexicana]
MQRFGAARRFGMLRATAAAAVLATALLGQSAVAVADQPPPGPGVPAPAQAPPAPAPASTAGSLTLTTIPAGWQVRTDLAPTLQVQPDGRAVASLDAASPDRPVGAAPKSATGRVAPDVVNSALAEAKSLADADMGMPSDADGSSTMLDFLGATPDQDVHLIVYSQGKEEGLSQEQLSQRKRFDDLCKKLLSAFAQDR